MWHQRNLFWLSSKFSESSHKHHHLLLNWPFSWRPKAWPTTYVDINLHYIFCTRVFLPEKRWCRNRNGFGQVCHLSATARSRPIIQIKKKKRWRYFIQLLNPLSPLPLPLQLSSIRNVFIPNQPTIQPTDPPFQPTIPLPLLIPFTHPFFSQKKKPEGEEERSTKTFNPLSWIHLLPFS